MQILGNYNECLTPSKLEIGKVYIFSENSASANISASIYLGNTRKGDFCFYVLMYLKTVTKENNVYLVNDKELELLPKIVNIVMSSKVMKPNILIYAVIRQKVLKDLNLKINNLSLWKTKQKMLDQNSLPILDEEGKKRKRKYILKKDLKEGCFYYNQDYLFHYIGYINNKYCFHKVSLYSTFQFYNNGYRGMLLGKNIIHNSSWVEYNKFPCIYTVEHDFDEIGVTKKYINIVLEELRSIRIYEN